VNSSQISDLVSRSTALRVKIVLQCDIVLLYKFFDEVMKAAKIFKAVFLQNMVDLYHLQQLCRFKFS